MADRKPGRSYEDGPKVAAIGGTVIAVSLLGWGMSLIPGIPALTAIGIMIGAGLVFIGIAMRLFPDSEDGGDNG